MAEPLTLQFGADVSRAQNAIASLAGTVVSNMASMGAAMSGGAASTNSFGQVFGANMMKASTALGLVTQNTDKTNAALERMVRIAVALPGIAMGLAQAAVGFVVLKVALDAVAAAGKAAMDALEGTAKIGDEADRLGVSTTFLQSYHAQARNLKLEVEDVTKSLEQAKVAFTIRQGDNGNPNQSAFVAQLRRQQAAGNVTPEQVSAFGRANGEEAQYRAALTIIEQLLAKGKEVAALDLASKIMPDKMVQNIRDGTIELDKLKKGIDDLKNPRLVLLSPEEIARAQDLQRRLEVAQSTIDAVGKEFNRDLARAGAQLAEDAIRWKETIAEGARILLNASRFMREAGQEFRQGGGMSSGGNPSGSAGAMGALLGREAAKSRGIMTNEEFGPTVDVDREAAMRRLGGNLSNRTLIEQAQRNSLKMSRGIRENTNPFPEAKKTKAPSTASEIDPIETFINQLEKSAAALKAEADAFDKSNAEKRTAIEMAKAQEIASQNGKSLTDAQTESIKKAAAETGNYRDKIQDLEQAQRQAAEATRYFGQMAADAIGDAVLEGRAFNDVLTNITKSIARATLQGIFTGQGPMAGILGTAAPASAAPQIGGLAGLVSSALGGGGGLGGLLSGGGSGPVQGPTLSGATLDTVAGGNSLFNLIGSVFRANGGPVRAGMPYTVGEMGREMFIPNQDGRIVPIDGGPGGGGGGGSTTYIGGDTISIAPAGGVTFEQMAAFFAARDQRLQRDLPMLTARSQSRFGVPKR